MCLTPDEGGLDEPLEERVRTIGARLELWMGLGPHKEGVVRTFHKLYESPIRG